MAIPTILAVSAALAYAQTSKNPIAVVDNNSNIANNLDALTALGTQLVSVQDNSGSNLLSSPISVAGVLALAPKMTDYCGNPYSFGNITDTAAHVNASSNKLLALTSQIPAGGIHVNDTAAPVASVSAKLLSLGSLISAGGIHVNDNALNVAANATTLALLGTELSATVTDTAASINLRAAKLTSLINLGATLSVIVADSAANSNANQAKLLAWGTTLHGFSLPDGTTINILSTDGTSISMDAADAIAFFKEGLAAPINIVDSDSNIAANLNALVVMGRQLLSVQDSTSYWFSYPINVANVLTLAAKMFDSAGYAEVFGTITDTAANIANNASQLLAIGSQIGENALHITDTAANIVANAATLEWLAPDIQAYDSDIIVNVVDSVANINAAMNTLLSLGNTGLWGEEITLTITLPDGSIINIQSSDGTSLTLNTTDTLNFIHSGLVAPIHLADYWGNIANKIYDLVAISSQLMSVQDTTGYSTFGWTINVTEVLALGSKMIDAWGNPNTFNNINDSLFTVIANTAPLLALGKQIAAGGIHIADTAANISANLAMLAPLRTELSITVGDTAGNINTYLPQLLSLGNTLHSFVLPDGVSINILSSNSTSLILDVHNASVLVGVGLHIPFHIIDNNWNIGNNINNLATIGSQLLSVQDTTSNSPFNGPINVADVLALAPIMFDSSGNHETFSNINDSLSAVTANATQLLALNTQLTAGSIHFTDTVANLTANSATLAKLGTDLSASIYDSSTNVLTNLNKLQAMVSQISTISFTDTSTPTPTISASQFVQDASVLGKINSPYNIALTGKGTQALAIAASQFIADVAVLSHINTPYKITLTDKITPTITLTASQFTQDAALLGKISSSYHLAITGESVANVAADAKNSHVTAMGVIDCAANVLVNLDSLQTLASKISGITLTDTGTPTFAITASQFNHGAAILGKISPPYALAISYELAANVVADAKNSHVCTIGLVDTAAHVSNSLAGLESNVNKLSGIILTDKATPTISLTATQITNDSGALNAIQEPYLLSVKDSVTNINNLALTGINNSLLEIMPTSLTATLTENSYINNLNLSMIKLTGDSINEKVYNGTGTEIDIIANKGGAVIEKMFFANDSESQLHLLGIGNTVVHML